MTSDFLYFFHLTFHSCEIQVALVLRLLHEIHGVVHKSALETENKARSSGLDKDISLVR